MQLAKTSDVENVKKQTYYNIMCISKTLDFNVNQLRITCLFFQVFNLLLCHKFHTHSR